jgi:hypothetical protein
MTQKAEQSHMNVEATTHDLGADVTTAIDKAASNSAEHVNVKTMCACAAFEVDEKKDLGKIGNGEDIEEQDDNAAAAEEHEEDEEDKEVAEAANRNEVKTNYPRSR